MFILDSGLPYVDLSNSGCLEVFCAISYAMFGMADELRAAEYKKQSNGRV